MGLCTEEQAQKFLTMTPLVERAMGYYPFRFISEVY